MKDKNAAFKSQDNEMYFMAILNILKKKNSIFQINFTILRTNASYGVKMYANYGLIQKFITRLYMNRFL